MDLSNKSVVITGAGRGLGRALAIAFAARGNRVLVVSRNADELDEVTTHIRNDGGIAHAFVADVADKNAAHAIATVAAELVGNVDILVHNASTLGTSSLRRWVDTDCEDFEHALQVNAVGAFRITKAIVGSMIVHNGGLIVNVSSDAAENHYERWGAYGASKAAADHLARTLAEELRGSGVDILTVDPGEMNTAMHAQAVPDADRNALADPTTVARALVHALATQTVVTGSRLVAPAFGVPS